MILHRSDANQSNVLDRGADENRCENGEDIGLHQANEDFERHQRDRHEQPGERHDQRDDELAAHHIAEQAHHQREGARHLGDEVERQHDQFRLGEAREIAEQPCARTPK